MERQWIEVMVAPKSFGPQEWPFDDLVGAIMPVLTEAEVGPLPAGTWAGPELDEQGFVVSLCNVVVSLQALGQDRAVGFWQAMIDADQGRYVRFERSVCELVDAPSLERTSQALQKR